MWVFSVLAAGLACATCFWGQSFDIAAWVYEFVSGGEGAIGAPNASDRPASEQAVRGGAVGTVEILAGLEPLFVQPSVLDRALMVAWANACSRKHCADDFSRPGSLRWSFRGYGRRADEVADPIQVSAQARSDVHLKQFSPGRAKKRVLGKPQAAVKVQTRKWDFTRVAEDEFLLAMPMEEMRSRFAVLVMKEEGGGGGGGGGGGKVPPPSLDLASSSVKILLNLHPVSPMHMLILPPGADVQFLTLEGIRTAFLVAERSRNIRLFYNSVGAGSSVNHLHWQAWVAPRTLPADLAQREVLGKVLVSGSTADIEEDSGDSPISLSVLKNWGIPESMFELRQTLGTGKTAPAESNRNSNQSSDHLAALVCDFVTTLQELNIPHNVFVRSIVNASAEKKDLVVLIVARNFDNGQSVDPELLHVAGLELLGWWILVRQDIFETETGTSLDRVLQKVRVLGESAPPSGKNVILTRETFLEKVARKTLERGGAEFFHNDIPK